MYILSPATRDYKERNEIEDLYTDALQMKGEVEYRQISEIRPKHSFKATVDFQWKRINLGANFCMEEQDTGSGLPHDGRT